MTRPFLVVDLEATCDRRGFPRNKMEIIEIGAVLVDASSLAPVDEFQTFVRPILRPKLTPFCTELTTITQDLVDDAPTFPEAIDALARWLPGPVRWASWGAYDKNQLLQDARLHQLTVPYLSDHLNIKAAFAEQVSGRKMGMKGALRHVGLPLDGTHHRGIDDARNIVKLLPYVVGR